MKKFYNLLALLAAFFLTNESLAQSFNFSVTTSTVCFTGGASTINAVVSSPAPGATSYSWSMTGSNCNGSISPNGVGVSASLVFTCSGVYTVVCFAFNNTVSTVPVLITSVSNTISVNPIPGVFGSSPSWSICSGDSIVLTATGATTYTWLPGNIVSNSIQVAPLSTGFYTVSGSSLGCTSMSTVFISVTPGPVLSVLGNTAICMGPTASTTLTAFGAASYTWMGQGINTLGATIIISPSVSTCYTLTGDNGTCTSSLVKCVLVNPSPNISVTTNTGSVCLGSSFTLTASGASSYTWSMGSMGNPMVVTPISTACYSVIGMNAFMCLGMATTCVTVMTTPISIAASSPSVCLGTSVTFTASGANTYVWSTSATTSTINVIPPSGMSAYSVTGTGANGCIGTSTIGMFADNSCSDVWPGDANSDGVVGTTDVLEIGLGFSSTGAARTPGGNTYVSQYAANWTGTVSSGKNLNHADCNGDGTINANDTLAIFNNFSLTHAFKPGGAPVSDPDISLLVDNNIVYEGQWNKADVILGSSANAINQLYGVAFDIDFDNSLIETASVYMKYPTSFLDNANQNVIFRKPDFTSGKLFAATVRTDGNNVNGNGKIAEFYFKVKSGVPTNSSINLSVSNATKIDADGVSGVLSNGTAAPVISNNLVGIQNTNTKSLKIEVFPNPAKNLLYINTTSTSKITFVVSDLIGRQVQNGVFDKQAKLDVSSLQNGAYIIQLNDGSSTEYRKIIIEK